MKHFTMYECTYSATAREKGIRNTPSAKIQANIKESIDNLVNPQREAWGDYCERNGLGMPRHPHLVGLPKSCAEQDD